jgi:hypothetical protein
MAASTGVPVDDVIALTKWGAKWLRYAFDFAVGNGPEQVMARGLVHAFDKSTTDANEFIVDRVTALTVTESSRPRSEGGWEIVPAVPKVLVENVKRTTRVRKGNRSHFAMALGKRAYVKFGARPVSEANVIVTRKWLLKVIEEEFKDLRDCDKAIALDRSTFLSFIPTMSHNNYKFIFHGKNDVTRRIDGENLFSRIAHWANPAK